MKLIWRLLAGAILLWLAVVRPAAAASSGGCLPLTGVVNGVQFAQAINAGFSALLSSNSGAAAPGNDCSGGPVIGQIWYDTSGAYPVWRIYDGSAWEALVTLDPANAILMRAIGGGVTTMTAASVTDICAVPQSLVSIGGTTTIQSFGASCRPGEIKTVTFAATLALVHSAANILIPTGATIATQAGDRAILAYAGAGVWSVVAYTRADGTALKSAPSHYAGEVIFLRTPNCPDKTVPEDGRAVSRTDYPALFAAIGTSWGAGNGSTTMNVPNSSGNFDRGWIAGQSVDSGRVFGALQGESLASHSHGVNIGVSSSVSASGSTSGYFHSNSGNVGTSAGGGGQYVNQGGYSEVLSVSVSGTASGTVKGSTAAAGGSETRPRNIPVYHCIFLVDTP